ncbi:CDP-diacylglycerol diphosphatase [Stenotrophomonas sp. 278]|uniref:CDP-diacylglycerol diphosphatase n=1 Tax=Stenotrophomonas sp. 278 TaxID=2479851 RepID=UPI0021AE1EDC|nr:CDP-diacylglycerol diphosphatase [Stenotrophomonas sp. 278]
MSVLRVFLLALPLCLAACTTAPPPKPAPNPDALWGVIQRDCVGTDTPRGSCLAVSTAPERRDVLVKDTHGDYQFLLMPLDKVSGIESPDLLQAGTPNYFAAAWQARAYTERALGQPLPRDVASLALNSAHGRSQNQLHIHVDCLRADIRDQLQAMQPAIGPTWQPLPQPLRGHVYQARRLDGETLTADPIRLLADDLAAPGEMGRWSLVVVGQGDDARAPGFVLLATQADADAGHQASGEELQDHACAVLTGASQALDGVR